MANKIILKKSAVGGKIPLSSDLDYGELAINYADGKLYYKNSANNVASIGGSGGGTISVIGRSGPIGVSATNNTLIVAARSGNISVSF